MTTESSSPVKKPQTRIPVVDADLGIISFLDANENTMQQRYVLFPCPPDRTTYDEVDKFISSYWKKVRLKRYSVYPVFVKMEYKEYWHEKFIMQNYAMNETFEFSAFIDSKKPYAARNSIKAIFYMNYLQFF